MQKKFLRIGSLALLQIVIVGNLQILPANAVYGYSLPFLLGFVPPAGLSVDSIVRFHIVMIAGLVFAMMVPCLLAAWGRDKKTKLMKNKV